jgi:hypothetical protein
MIVWMLVEVIDCGPIFFFYCLARLGCSYKQRKCCQILHGLWFLINLGSVVTLLGS